PSGDGGHDTDGIAILGGRIFLFQITNILVIEVDIHEAANAAILGVEVLAQVSVRAGQLLERVADRSGIELHSRLLAHELPQGGRNFKLHCHDRIASSLTLRWKLRMPRATADLSVAAATS